MGTSTRIVEAMIIDQNIYTSTYSQVHGNIIYNSFVSRMVSPSKRQFIDNHVLVLSVLARDRGAITGGAEIQVTIRDGKEVGGDTLKNPPIIERCIP